MNKYRFLKLFAGARSAKKVRAYFNRQKIAVDFDALKPFPRTIGDILNAADQRRVAGVVAKHLVGAKLAIRFPSATIENHTSTPGDQQFSWPGDFQMNDTVFHVTISPQSDVIHRCAENLKHGFRPMLLVPHRRVEAARQLLKNNELFDQVNVLAIERFVGQNLDELAEFRQDRVGQRLREFLEEYNRRIAEVETDLSLQVEIPANL